MSEILIYQKRVRATSRRRFIVAGGMMTVVIASVLGGAFVLLEQRPADLRTRGQEANSDGAPPRIPLPVVEDLVLQDYAPDDAVAINAKVPFSEEPNPPAAPFQYPVESPGYWRAIDCLAAAVYYEAGDDLYGQQAVAQVVLNRVRHPAFRPSVCAVVFQGSERTTGCQFTFTCDGSIARRTPSTAAWSRARSVARLALAGYVFRPVGHATHYHTNWVVPYWSDSLDKIVAVGTHLFFRWDGWWGTPKAFSVRPVGTETALGKLASLSPAHADADDETPRLAYVIPDGVPEVSSGSGCAGDCGGEPVFSVQTRNGDSTILLAHVTGSQNPEQFPTAAAKLCGARPRCVIMAWSDAERIPANLPASAAQLQTMDFQYQRDPLLTEARVRWNCARFPDHGSGRCLSQ